MNQPLFDVAEPDPSSSSKAHVPVLLPIRPDIIALGPLTALKAYTIHSGGMLSFPGSATSCVSEVWTFI